MKDILSAIGLEFNQLIVLIVVIVFSVIAIKLTITFDLNRYLEDRKKMNMNRLRNACTHHQVVSLGEQHSLQSLFISPPGTVQWQCQQCGAAKYFSDGELERMTQYYLDNFEEFVKQQKKFQKLMKKNKLT